QLTEWSAGRAASPTPAARDQPRQRICRVTQPSGPTAPALFDLARCWDVSGTLVSEGAFGLVARELQGRVIQLELTGELAQDVALIVADPAADVGQQARDTPDLQRVVFPL